MALFTDLDLLKHTVTICVFYISALILVFSHFSLISKWACLQDLIILSTALKSVMYIEVPLHMFFLTTSECIVEQ